MSRAEPCVVAVEALEDRKHLSASSTLKLVDFFPPNYPAKSVTVVPRSVRVVERSEVGVRLELDVEAGRTYQFQLRRNDPLWAWTRYAGQLWVTTPADPHGPAISSAEAPGRVNRLIYRAEQDETIGVYLSRKGPWRQTFSVKEIATTTDERAREVVTPGRVRRAGGRISGPGDVDRFSFEAKEGGFYTFRPIAETLKDTVLRVLDPEGKQVAFLDRELIYLNGPEQRVGRNPTLKWLAPSDGRYVLEVGGHSAGRYHLETTARLDDHLTVTPIPTPGAATGSLDHATDVDVFTFEAVAGRTYRIGSDDAVLILLNDPSNLTINPSQTKRITPWGRPDFAFTASASGTYTLNVGFGRHTGLHDPEDYVVSVEALDPPA